MSINSDIAELRSRGVVSRSKGDSLTISKIPSWRLYLLADSIKRELAAIAVAKQVFTTPIKPIQFDADRDNRCNFCQEFQQNSCMKFPKKIPPHVFKPGCDRFTLNNHVFF
jgi:hypothetical protein